MEKENSVYEPGDYGVVDIVHKFWRRPWTYIMDKAIKWFTQSKVNHAFIVVSTDGDIVEAQPKGAAKNNISKYDLMTIRFSVTELTPEQREEIVKNALDSVGTPYGFLDIIYLGLVLKGIKSTWLWNKVQSQANEICSQLVAADGVKALATSWLCGKKYAQLVTPGDLDNLITIQSKDVLSHERASDLRKRKAAKNLAVPVDRRPQTV